MESGDLNLRATGSSGGQPKLCPRVGIVCPQMLSDHRALQLANRDYKVLVPKRDGAVTIRSIMTILRFGGASSGKRSLQVHQANSSQVLAINLEVVVCSPIDLNDLPLHLFPPPSTMHVASLP